MVSSDDARDNEKSDRDTCGEDISDVNDLDKSDDTDTLFVCSLLTRIQMIEWF